MNPEIVTPNTTPSLREALKKAELLYDRHALDARIARLAAQIDADFAADASPDCPPVYLTLMQGGMWFSALLALQLKTPFVSDYLHASRYRGQVQGDSVQWLHQPELELQGRQVLLIDDILDEGHTLEVVRAYCLAAGAAQVRIAVLCRKKHGRCFLSVPADYVGVDLPDRFVFGFGMDYYEQGRQLPAIYAL